MKKYIIKSIDIVKANPIPFLGIALLYTLLEVWLMKNVAPHMATGSINSLLGKDFTSLGLGILCSVILGLVFMVGFLKMVVAALNGETVKVNDFSKNLNVFDLKRIITLELIITPIMIVGLLLLVVPGVVWKILVYLSYYIILSEPNVKPMDAIKRSIDSFTWTRAWVVLLYGFISFVSSIHISLSIILDTFSVTLFYLILGQMYFEEKNKEKVEIIEGVVIEEKNNIQIN